MTDSGHTWAIVLAAGEGSRLRSLTTTSVGVAVPKQFCSLHGGPSLLHDAVRRAESIAPAERICTIVAQQHRHWWEDILKLLPERNVIVQPDNRGTAVGILLPLLRILMRDPDARVVLLPSDHHVRDEAVLARALRTAISEIETRPDRIVVLGMAPEEPDPELGYVVPGESGGNGVARVDRFVEKPSAPLAQSLVAQGALWNAFIIAAHARTLLHLFTMRVPRVVTAMQTAVQSDDPVAVAQLYEQLDTIDFSTHVMQGAESMLDVLSVAQCGWSDLGTPGRVAETLRRSPQRAPARDRTSTALTGVLSLAAVQRRHSPAS
jgi:mannose-1-phosphate guanylyltransferase